MTHEDEPREILIFTDKTEFLPEIEYTFSTILQRFRLRPRVTTLADMPQNPHSPIVAYSDSPISRSIAHLRVVPDGKFWSNFRTIESLPQRCTTRFEGTPLLYGNSNLTEADGVLTTEVDIVASSFVLLTRYEEYIITARDQYGRFPLSSSILADQNLLETPLVDHYAELLRSWLQRLGVEIKPPQHSNRLRIMLTHDIDHMRLYRDFSGTLRSIGSILLRWHSLPTVGRYLSGWARSMRAESRDPFDTFDLLRSVAGKHGLKSTYFFLAGREVSRDGSYLIDEPAVKATIAQLIEEGHEIGLHGSFNSFDDTERLRCERDRLEEVADRPVTAVRQHYLRFDAAKTWKAQADAGFRFDTTLTFAEKVGFRCGTVHPFFPFDLESRAVLHMIEVPTTVMDGSLIEPHYMHLSFDAALSKCEQLLARVKAVGGIFVVIWHNSSLNDVLYPGWTRIYEEIVNLASSKGARSVIPGELLREHFGND